MKKATKVKKACIEEDEAGRCCLPGSKHKGRACVGDGCKDFEEALSGDDLKTAALFKKAAPPDALKWQTCAHSDADGRCANPDSNGQGGACTGCEDYMQKAGNAKLSSGDGSETAVGTPVPRPSQACAPAREGGNLPEVTADDVARCYLNAVCGVLHVIRFGCMMLVKEACLEFETGVKPGDPAYGRGLKGWLRDNAPDVNYKTAMGFKSTAAKVCEVLVFPPDVMLRAMNPDPKALPEEEDGELLITVRERLLEIIHGKNSLHAFRLWLTGGAPAPADGKDAEDAGKADELALDAAKRFGRAASDALKCLDPRQRNAMTKALARHLRESLGLKGLAWLAKVLEEAEG